MLGRILERQLKAVVGLVLASEVSVLEVVWNGARMQTGGNVRAMFNKRGVHPRKQRRMRR